VLHAAVSAIGGLHLSLILGCPMAAAVVVAGTLLFGVAWAISWMRQRARTIVSDIHAVVS
jgi:ABC-type Mn2+/Zn2+ transport system permease subunit